MFKKDKVPDFVPNRVEIDIVDKDDKVLCSGKGFYTRYI